MGRIGPVLPTTHCKEMPMKGLPAVLFCIMLAAALVACSQDKGKAPTEKRAAAQAQSKAPTQAQKKAKKAQKQAQKKAPTLAQKKQQDRSGECTKQANLRNTKGEERRRFISSCLGGGA
jgi:uncharacterized protein HemX